ncbi:hypothetical protein F5Y13DRAFT_195259 [Hypoxylon sp. FL1857]|nr:hypothetical protein F5Y13DRAFT_195259 [Hypoxylon sp. FL1857]
MPIEETLNFNADKYRREVRSHSMQKLKQQEIATGRKIITGSFAVGAGLGAACFTGGLTLLLAGYKGRSTYVANKKHEILQGELHRRNVAFHDIDAKDMAIAGSIATIAFLVGAEVGDFTEGITNIESMEGVGGQIHQVVEHLTGGSAMDVATTVSAANSTAYHAGMVQAQILEEHIVSEATEAALLSLASAVDKPSPHCKHSEGALYLKCSECKEGIKEEYCYWRKCFHIKKDSYDVL